MLEFDFPPIKVGKGRLVIDIDVELEDGTPMEFNRNQSIRIMKPLTPTQEIEEINPKPIKVSRMTHQYTSYVV